MYIPPDDVYTYLYASRFIYIYINVYLNVGSIKDLSEQPLMYIPPIHIMILFVYMYIYI
jgi:hypothetical protein